MLQNGVVAVETSLFYKNVIKLPLLMDLRRMVYW